MFSLLRWISFNRKQFCSYCCTGDFDCLNGAFWLAESWSEEVNFCGQEYLTEVDQLERQTDQSKDREDKKRIKCFAFNSHDFVVLSQQSIPNSHNGHNHRAAPGFPPVTHNHPPSYWTWCQACPHRSPSWPLHMSWFGKEPWWDLSLQARSTVTNPPPATWYLLRPQKTFLCLPARDDERTKIRTVDQLL